jgi:DUF1680 family protein
MNVSRLVASVGGYFVSTAPDGVAFHLYGGVSTNVTVGSTKVHLRETSNYPWSGDIAIEIDPETPAAFDVKLRIPGWCSGWSLKVNGASVQAKPADGYLTIHRTWSKGDRVVLDLPMPPERIYANPAVIMDAGRVALKRGPLVYCVEEADNPGGFVQRLKIGRDAELVTSTRADLFDGIVTLSAKGTAIQPDDWTGLYRNRRSQEQPATLTAIPYYLWANRGQGSMMVWVPEA